MINIDNDSTLCHAKLFDEKTGNFPSRNPSTAVRSIRFYFHHPRMIKECHWPPPTDCSCHICSNEIHHNFHSSFDTLYPRHSLIPCEWNFNDFKKTFEKGAEKSCGKLETIVKRVPRLFIVSYALNDWLPRLIIEITVLLLLFGFLLNVNGSVKVVGAARKSVHKKNREIIKNRKAFLRWLSWMFLIGENWFFYPLL